MTRVLDQGSSAIENVAALLDQCRAWLLERTMRVTLLRRIYTNCSLRLSTIFFLATMLYLPLALRRPDILLVIGPFLSGYAHLIASYWFVQKHSQRLGRAANSAHFVQLLSAVTLASIITHWAVRGMGLLPDMPFGTWEVGVSVFALVTVRLLAKNLSAKETAACLLANAVILHFAWREPILFVGGVLIVHNWVAFIYWIMVAKGRERKAAAILASVLFGLIHYVVLSGKTDLWFPIGGTAEFPGNQEITGWYLASWSDDPVVWYRAIVVYAYGISMHYFVWLKAIPESLSKNERPNCFRLTVQRLRADVGSNFLVLCIGLMAVGMLVWCLSFTLGQTIYFAVAALHGWLEITFLICWIVAFFTLGTARLTSPRTKSAHQTSDKF